MAQASFKPAILADFAKLPEMLAFARNELSKSSPATAQPMAGDEAQDAEDPKQLNLF